MIQLRLPLKIMTAFEKNKFIKDMFKERTVYPVSQDHQP